MMDSVLLSNIILVCAAITLVMLVLLVIRIVKISRKGRRFSGKGKKGLVVLTGSLGLLGGIAYLIYQIPDILFYGVRPWAMLDEMGPTVFINAIIAVSTLVLILYLNFIIFYFTVKPGRER
jgi:putative pyoverdin transport system ATP-binding/permease protein